MGHKRPPKSAKKCICRTLWSCRNGMLSAHPKLLLLFICVKFYRTSIGLQGCPSHICSEREMDSLYYTHAHTQSHVIDADYSHSRRKTQDLSQCGFFRHSFLLGLLILWFYFVRSLNWCAHTNGHLHSFTSILFAFCVVFNT